MIKNKLKSEKGDASAMPMLLIIITTFVFAIFTFYNTISLEIYNYNVKRYMNAVDLATRTGFYNIDFDTQTLSYDTTDTNTYNAEELIALGLFNPSATTSSSTDKQVSTILRLKIDKTKFTSEFYNVLFGNVGLFSKIEQNKFKTYIPLKGILENDTLFLSNYNDEWIAYPLAYFDTMNKYYKISDTNSSVPITNKTIFFSLDSNMFYLKDSTKSYKLESNREYLKSTIDDRKMITSIITKHIENFLNVNHKPGEKYITINFNKYDPTNTGDEFVSLSEKDFFTNVNGIGFFCFINGLPIKTITSDKVLTTFYSLDLGSSGLTRKDLAGTKNTITPE